MIVARSFDYDSLGRLPFKHMESSGKNQSKIQHRHELFYDACNRLVRKLVKYKQPNTAEVLQTTMLFRYDSIHNTISNKYFSHPGNQLTWNKVILLDSKGRMIADTLYNTRTNAIIWYLNYVWNAANNVETSVLHNLAAGANPLIEK